MPGQAGKYSSSQQNGTVVSRATSSTATSSAMLAPPPNPGIKARSHSPTHVAAQAARGLVWCLTSTACAPGALYLGAAAPPDAPPPDDVPGLQPPASNRKMPRTKNVLTVLFIKETEDRGGCGGRQCLTHRRDAVPDGVL